jgi:hypothetical protein
MKCESAICHQVDYANTPMFGQTQTAQVGNAGEVFDCAKTTEVQSTSDDFVCAKSSEVAPTSVRKRLLLNATCRSTDAPTASPSLGNAWHRHFATTNRNAREDHTIRNEIGSD